VELITDALVSGNGIISTQVVQEFLHVATQKFTTPMEVADSQLYLLKVLNPLCQVYPDLALYQTCLQIQDRSGYGFYDCLILAAAIDGRCDILYSEDFQDGQQVQGVQIVNPFLISV
jgi:predicted nucleic acid-binding protein